MQMINDYKEDIERLAREKAELQRESERLIEDN